MDLLALLKSIRGLPEYERLLLQLKSPDPVQGSLELPRAVRPPLLAAMYNDLKRPVVFLMARADRQLTINEELHAWLRADTVHQIPDPGPLFYEWAPWGDKVRLERSATLAALTHGEGPGAIAQLGELPPFVLASTRGTMTRTISKRTYLANSRYIKAGSVIRFTPLLELLVSIGYSNRNLVTGKGEFSHRGGILDVWPPAEPNPVRVEFFGDEAETLRAFDPNTQRTLNPVVNVRITPAREGLPKLYESTWDDRLPLQQWTDSFEQDQVLELHLPLMNPEPKGFIDYLPENALVVFDDRVAFESAVEEIEEAAVAMRNESTQTEHLGEDFPLPYLTLGELNEQLSQHEVVNLGMARGVDDLPTISITNAFTPGPRFGGQINSIIDYLQEQRQSHDAVLVVSRQAHRLSELWAEMDESVCVHDSLPRPLKPAEVCFVQGPLSEGWLLDTMEGMRLHLLTDAELFGWSRPRPRRRSLPRASAPEEAYADLEQDDFVVHVDYGIGRFIGLVQRTLDEVEREYLLIEYAGGDQLYVPIHQADRISRYVGSDGSSPKLSRLGSSEWERAKGRVREAVEEVAKDLLDLYATRQTVRGHAFSPDTAWQKELEASFAHRETSDQIEALREIKQDMERKRPMDRLICGDVGYGKTEVALRAAFKAVMDGKQVAILVPTTVLAQQHFHTFQRRLSAFPVEVEMLSRFRTRSEASQIVERLRSGEVDIIIGTHRLLQPDVGFKDLGLLIIDEEQRFGVTHKEYLKEMRKEVDVLTLTATPIPRSLYMALTGARDISTISTPPEDRLPVVTHVGPYEPRLVRAAILREIDRGGQIFFVHNRVQTINTMLKRLERLVPEARFAIAHGQMHENELSHVMDRFSQGEIDVLVSTSIIESGLDIPNANTLIVDRADRFGLAQLYQLRGRVGRAAIQGYAYFFRPAGQRATDEALQRLEIIAQHSQLGAGYAIAMRDLEMRGAGEILGTRQHGYIAGVGFHLYTRLLAQAVNRMRLETDAEELLPEIAPEQLDSHPAAIELPLGSVIPDDYIPDRDLRLQLYRRMAAMQSLAQIDSIRAELEDRFGPVPENVKNLLFQLEMKLLATKAAIERVTTEGGQILVEFSPERPLPSLDLDSESIRRSRRGLWINARENREWPEILKTTLEALAGELMANG
jgi:transcription-repair coupling factor (superfamily II helicase)